MTCRLPSYLLNIMRKPFKYIVLACLIAYLILAAHLPAVAQTNVPQGIKKMAITFDNLPADRNYSKIDRKEITRDILAALSKHDVKATGFVIGDNIEGDWELVVQWLDSGHTLGFMTYNGQDINNVPAEMYIDDIKKGRQSIEDLLETYRIDSRFFRFTYLHYGEKPKIKEEVERFLKNEGISIAHASIVTEDFVYNLSLEKNLNAQDSTKILRIGNEYLNHLLERLAYAETLALELADRPVRHILQLRANRINSYFLDDILSLLKEKGYKFISLEDALKDNVYKMPDEYYETRGVSFLQRIKFSNPDLIPAGE